MKIINPESNVAQIQRNPSMYLGGNSVATTEQLVLAIFSDAVLLGEKKIFYSQIAKWHILSGSNNWTNKGSCRFNSPLDIFNRITPFPEAGVNSIRSEILLTAFATNVFLSDCGNVYVVKGIEPTQLIKDQLPSDFSFSLGFCMN